MRKHQTKAQPEIVLNNEAAHHQWQGSNEFACVKCKRPEKFVEQACHSKVLLHIALCSSAAAVSMVIALRGRDQGKSAHAAALVAAAAGAVVG